MQLTSQQLLNQYREGQRYFSGIEILNANFTDANLKDIILKNSKLVYSNFDGANLENADLTDCELTQASFIKSNLKNTRFDKSTLFGANLQAAFFDGTSFRKANLMGAHLCKSDVMRSDMTDATLNFACLIDTKISIDQMTSIPGNVMKTISVEGEHKQQDSNKTVYGGDAITSNYLTKNSPLETYGSTQNTPKKKLGDYGKKDEEPIKKALDTYKPGGGLTESGGYVPRSEPTPFKVLEKKRILKK